MNKFLAGCLIAIGVVAVAVVGGGYFFLIKPAGEAFGGMIQVAKEFDSLNEKVDLKGDYEAAADAMLDAGQFERFLAAQRSMRGQLEGRLQTLKTKYEELEGRIDAEDRDFDIGEIAGAYADLADLIIEAKRAQVAALNEQSFSVAEYAWVRDRVYRAIGMSVAVMDPTQLEQARSALGEVPEATVAMVEPHRQELLETHVLAWFGL